MNRFRKALILILTAGIFLAVFYDVYQTQLKAFVQEAQNVEIRLSQQVKLSSDFIDLMGLYGNQYFTNGPIGQSPWVELLKEKPDRSGYHMDAVQGTELTRQVGNLTGLGPLNQSAEQMENINLALLFNTFFRTYYDTLPGITWLYYTGSEGFINIYPWAPSSDYAFSHSDFSLDWYRMGTPQQNPSRSRYWTPVYMDSAGKGLMVTVSRPIYDDDRFRGVISLDFTLDTLSGMMDMKHRSVIVNETLQVLAASGGRPLSSERIETLEDYLGEEASHALDLLLFAGSDQLSVIQGNYVHITDIRNSPWRMITFEPVAGVLFRSFLSSFPTLLIGVLLMFSYTGYERGMVTERKLKESIGQLEKSQKALETAASIDYLTGTLNRRSMTERLTEEVSRSQRHGSTFSVIMGDIDHFKSFNDRYGHAAGDKILIELSRVMRQNTRASDLIARWGGEEFLILLPDAELQQAFLTAEKLRQAIASLQLQWEHEWVQVTMSFGVAQYDPTVTLDRTILRSDDALYFAKKTGRNRTAGYNDLFHQDSGNGAEP